MTLFGHTKRICCIAMSNDEKKVVSGSFDMMIKVWDLETG